MNSIEQKNMVCLEILESLLSMHSETSQNLPAYESLVGLFFHELVIYLTGAYLLNFDNDQVGELAFPFCNKDYLENPVIQAFNYNPVRFHSSSLFPIGFMGSTVGTGGNISFDSRIEKYLFLAKNKIVPLDKSRFHLKHQGEQLERLRDSIKEFCCKYVLSKNADIFSGNFINYCKSFLSEEEYYIQKKILLIGSNVSIHNRLLSAQQLKHGNRAVCVGHGEQSPFFLDEPVFFYGDMSYCTDFISYGKTNPSDHQHKKFILTEPPKIWNRNSRKIKKIFLSEEQRISKGSRILYVPTLYSSNKRYGPFRDISDAEYLEWQKKIMNSDLDITIKVHPKGRKLSLNWKCETRWLEDCLQEYDFYIFDYISTASTLCLATKKPILFLDLGIRNISEMGLKSIKDSCTYYKVELDTPSVKINQILHEFTALRQSHSRANLLNEYSLCDNKGRRYLKEVLLELIKG